MASRRTSLERVLQKIKAIKPKSVDDLRNAGMKLRLLGRGLFRSGYKVTGCDLVLKFPREEKTAVEGREHTRSEMRRLTRMRKVEALKKFLPEVFYYDQTAGVIALRYYPCYASFEDQADAMGAMIGTLILRLTRISCSDIHTENVREGKRNAVIIDLGY